MNSDTDFSIKALPPGFSDVPPTIMEDGAGRGHAMSGPPMTVLVVDDEKDIVEEVVEVLEDEGCTCLTAYDATTALNLLDNHSDIGVVVSDIRMPGMDGMAMVAEIRRRGHLGTDISVIMVTGHAGMAEAIEALQHGVDDFLTKPISADRLWHAVERSLELSKLRWQDRAFKVALEAQVAERTAEAKSLAEALELQNEQLLAANRVKDEFLEMISHEVNTPLNGIIGFGQLMHDDAVAADDQAQIQLTSEILASGHRLHRSLQAILSMASAKGEQNALPLETASAGEMLSLVSDMVLKTADSRNITITINRRDEDIAFAADVQRLTQALRALVDNAVRYPAEGAQVSLSADMDEDGMVVFTVTDTGPGMTDGQRIDAMKPFQRGADVREDGIGGVGLGLPLARLFAELHGGSLNVVSTPGEGTTAVLRVLGRQVH